MPSDGHRPGHRRPKTNRPCEILLILALWLTGCSVASPTSVGTSTATRTPVQLGPTSTASQTPTAAAQRTATPTPHPYPDDAELRLGPTTASVELMAYVDMDCDLCLQFIETALAVQADHPQQLRLILRLYPLLSVNDKSAQAAAAVFAAESATSAWTIVKLLSENRAAWSALSVDGFNRWLRETAPGAGLESERWRVAMTEPDTLALVQAAASHGQTAVPGVPFAFVNQQPLLLGLQHENVEAAVRLAVLGEDLPNAPPANPARLPTGAILHGSAGAIELELLPNLAPLAVASFASLAEQGWYDGSGFYRVIPGEWLEAGDPTGTGLGGPGYAFDVELSSPTAFSTTGGIGLLNDGPGTNGSRFFISLLPRPDLAELATQFGQLVSGQELLQALPERLPDQHLLEPYPFVIEQVELIYD